MMFARSIRALGVGLLLTATLAACGNANTGGGAAQERGASNTNATAAAQNPVATADLGSSAVPGATSPANDTSATTAATSASGGTTATTAATGGAAGGAATGSGAAAGQPIKIGSKDFTEAILVAELYAQVLEDNGFKVERKLNLGGTPIAQAALLKGDIDLYPEYTSTGLLTILKQQPLADPKEIYNAVKKGYEDQFKLTWLQPSPFNDTQGLAVTQETAQKYSLKTYSDLAQKAGELRIGGPPEFAEREDGIKGLQKAYGGFQFKEFKQLGSGPLRYDALKNGDIDVVVAFTTDARISADKLVVLQDDKTFYPIYNIAPVLRQDSLTNNPKIADALNKLAPLLTDQAITGLNAQVDIDGKDPSDVAKQFLSQSGILTK